MIYEVFSIQEYLDVIDDDPGAFIRFPEDWDWKVFYKQLQEVDRLCYSCSGIIEVDGECANCSRVEMEK